MKKLLEITNDYNLSIAEIAVRYIKSIDGISSIVMGMDNVKQLDENVALLNMPCLAPNLKYELDNIFKDIPNEVLDPSQWEYNKGDNV